MRSVLRLVLLFPGAAAFTVRPIPGTQRHQQPPPIRSASIHRHVSSSPSGSSNLEANSSPPQPHVMNKQQPEKAPELTTTSSYRGIRRLEKFTRLPVWPVWSGVLIWIVQKLLGDNAAARLEDTWTGRVCPNFFDYQETSPFVMLVHHCHSFASWDPVRWIQGTFFPEGFPAHPHRGFITVTYILEGGFVHRDSTGVRQGYGGSIQNTMSSTTPPERPHTQWLHTGSGMLHEEMFDNTSSNWLKPVRQELYQLWLNVPANEKWSEPSTCLLGQESTTPLVVQKKTGVKTLVLAGSFQNHVAAAPVVSDVTLLHVQIPPHQQWTYAVPRQYETVVLYIRKGTGLECVTTASSSRTKIPVHQVAYMESTGELLELHNAGNDLVDFLLLAGEPLREPCFASGSMVMSSPNEINEAYADYQRGLFGMPWDHKLSDPEWVQHIEATATSNENKRWRR